MGYAANGFCFDTPDAAAAYACGHEYPVASAFVDASGQPASLVLECTSTSGNVLTIQRDVNGAVVGTSSLALTAPACDVTEWMTYSPFSMTAEQGAVVSAAVLGVWLAGWGWRAIYSVLRSRSVSAAEDD